MSTRAIYTFEDDRNTAHVYKHHDGYPSGAADAIAKALPYAWQLPRFEADEFAAAFVAGNKEGDGGVRLFPTRCQKPIDFATDIEYRYEITCRLGKLFVVAYRTNYWDEKPDEKEIYAGNSLEQLAAVEEHG